ncbi:MAG TPA: LysM peptidoglycan-binding domain-containing protein [Terriglobales bacterium]|nr:LysM peptidoglycan-binding domain-containing protein [Terriglobales bacterium]
MGIKKSLILALILGALALITTSCDTGEKHSAKAAPPPQAMAPTITAPAPVPAPKIQEPPPAPKPDPVDAMVAAAEKEYQAGQANYAAGHLDAAKQNFDRAFDQLTQGPVDVKSDSRLQQEFDKIVEGTSQLEVQALKQGDGFTEQKSLPAPIDEANEVTFPVDPKIKAAAEAELKATHFDLPLTMNDYVAGYINFYTNSPKGHATVERALTRAGRYREMIERILREEGVPQDLIYLAQAESGFQPLALSRVGARGLWQFMASRATGYDLNRNWWIDERQDPEKATRAAARHLKDLYNQFGDWYLAMAAYNSGPGNVQQAVQRTGFADFWELYRRNVLPKETKNYVPIILAMAIIAKNPKQYGLDDIQVDPPLAVDKIKIDYPVDLRLVAECVDASVDNLQDLNPSLLRMTTPKEGAFELNLPAGSKQKYLDAIAAIPVDKRVWWRYHKVAGGETLASIAREYRTTPAAITEVNGLTAEEISPDTKLIIPIAEGKHAPGDVESLVFSRHATRYRVRRGDTVLSVADDFGVPPQKLRQWNRLKGNELRKGRTLYIYRPLPAGRAEPEMRTSSKSSRIYNLQTSTKASSKANDGTVAASSGRTHTVQPGETLYSIANDYGTTVDALKRENKLASALLHPGDVLVIK